MKIIAITPQSPLWERTIAFAQSCSWRAGPYLASLMRKNAFTDWERVFVALEGDELAGYCTLAKTDTIPAAPYTPYTGFVFVSERFRGARVSEKMLAATEATARALGFSTMHIVSGEKGLYEKYGYAPLKNVSDYKPGSDEVIFAKALA